MIKNPHLIKKLQKKERKADVPFAQKVQRYDEMYELAKLLNPDFEDHKNERHLNHIIHLVNKMRELAKPEQEC